MNIGKVLNTFSAKKGQSGLPRPKVSSLQLIKDFGIKEDKFAGKNNNRTVMIVGIYAYNLAKEHNINLEIGSLGENLLLDFNPHDYDIGTILQIGNTKIQITETCTICNHLNAFDDYLPILVQNCRGLYCKIIEGGEIRKNSPVKIIKEQIKKIAS